MIMVVEPEPLQALSVRKLVLESAKFNVLTAHSTVEAIDCLKLFPNIAAAVLVAEYNIRCDAIAQAIKNDLPQIPVIALSARDGFKCAGADHHLSSYNPEHLVQLVRELLGDPRTTEVQKNKIPL